MTDRQCAAEKRLRYSMQNNCGALHIVNEQIARIATDRGAGVRVWVPQMFVNIQVSDADHRPASSYKGERVVDHVERCVASHERDLLAIEHGPTRIPSLLHHDVGMTWIHDRGC